MDRRDFIIGSAAGVAAATAAGPLGAQSAYPERPVTVINPFPPGGAADTIIRPFAAALEPIIKQPVVIETKPGAAGALGAQVAASAKPDGYALMVHIVSLLGFAEVDRVYGRPVKFTKDGFEPIVRLVADPMVLLTNDKAPYKTAKDLVDDVKKRPNQVIYSTSGLHGAAHLPTAMFMKSAGLQMKHLPTNGGGPMVRALMGNNSQLTIASYPGTISLVKSGKLRPLAVAGASRVSGLPNVPTFKELGYDVEFYLWVGLFAPKGTPKPIIDKLRAVSKTAAESDRYKQALKNLSQEPAFLDAPEFKAFIDSDARRIEEAVRQIGKV